MKLKTTVIAAAVLSLSSITASQAAVELTPKQAEELKPYERITVTGRFNAIYEASDAVSRRADKMGAYAFYIQSLDDIGDSGNMRVVADVFAKDAPKFEESNRRIFGGVEEMSKTDAAQYEPFDTVSVSGFYPSQPDLYEAIAKKAKEKDAASFYV
ncbi:MAG: YdgH/BhsA/McbA-like domain containing protein, partial [Providencia sp.]